MPTRVQLPDGSIGEFPDGMPESQIEAVLQKQFGGPQAGPERPGVPAAPLPSGLTGPRDTRNALQQEVDADAEPDSAQKVAGQSSLETGLDALGHGFTRTLIKPAVHPLDTLKGLANTAADLGDANVGNYRPNNFVANTIDSEGKKFKTEPLKEAIPDALGEIGGVVTGGKALESAASALPEVGSSIRTAAIGDPDVAALRGLRVPASSPKTLNTLNSVQGARPYLQGADSLEDLQTRIPKAKAEIWQPYQQTIDAIGDNPVKGPDGVTTIRDLEKERLQTSALLRGLKSRSPEAIQLAQQKGLTEAQLLGREQQIKAALDPHLERAGIDPQEIRARFGNVAQIGGKISGKSTLAEQPQPYGFGKMMDLQLDNPRSWLGSPMQGLRDIVAGRPLWRGMPTDVNLREAFRTAGPKPDLGSYSPSAPKGLLSAPEDVSEIPHEFGTPVSRATVTPPPQVFPRLPSVAGEGELQPMIGIKAPQHPGIAEDFARTRIAPTKGQLNRMPRTILPPEHQGLALPSPETLALPAIASDGDLQPMIGVKAPSPYPPLAEDFARTRIAPNTFKGPSSNMLKGLLPAKASRAARSLTKK